MLVSSQGASLQTFNTQLIQQIEQLQQHLALLSDKLGAVQGDISATQGRIDALLTHKEQLLVRRERYEKQRAAVATLLRDSKRTYTKIVESSQTLLQVLKKESESVFDDVDDSGDNAGSASASASLEHDAAGNKGGQHAQPEGDNDNDDDIDDDLVAKMRILSPASTAGGAQHPLPPNVRFDTSAVVENEFLKALAP